MGKLDDLSREEYDALSPTDRLRLARMDMSRISVEDIWAHSDILGERIAQRERYDDAHDDKHTAPEWVALLALRLGDLAEIATETETDPADRKHHRSLAKKAATKLAAVAMALIAAINRAILDDGEAETTGVKVRAYTVALSNADGTTDSYTIVASSTRGAEQYATRYLAEGRPIYSVAYCGDGEPLVPDLPTYVAPTEEVAAERAGRFVAVGRRWDGARVEFVYDADDAARAWEIAVQDCDHEDARLLSVYDRETEILARGEGVSIDELWSYIQTAAPTQPAEPTPTDDDQGREIASFGDVAARLRNEIATAKIAMSTDDARDDEILSTTLRSLAQLCGRLDGLQAAYDASLALVTRDTDELRAAADEAERALADISRRDDAAGPLLATVRRVLATLLDDALAAQPSSEPTEGGKE